MHIAEGERCLAAHVPEVHFPGIGREDLKDIVASVPFNGVERIRAELVKNERQQRAVSSIGVQNKNAAGPPDGRHDPAPARQHRLAEESRVENRPRLIRHVLPHELHGHIAAAYKDIGHDPRKLAGHIHQLFAKFGGVIHGQHEKLHVRVGVGIAQRPLQAADHDHTGLPVYGRDLFNEGAIPGLHLRLERHPRHIPGKACKIVERTFRNPGGLAALPDIPARRIHTKEADPAGNLARHPVVHRIIHPPGDVHPDACKGARIDFRQLRKAIRPPVIPFAVFFQDGGIVEQVVGHHPVRASAPDGCT